MARLGRYFVEGQSLHVIQRGNDRRMPRCTRAEQYRQKAKELRVLAQRMSSNEVKKMFLDMVQDYLHMAETLDRMGGPRPIRNSRAAHSSSVVIPTGAEKRRGRSAAPG
jgi:REP element-mobilizing transposase RayT